VIIEYRDKDKEKALEFVKKLKEKLENSIYNTPIPKPLPPKTSLQIEEKGEPEIILNPNSLKKYNQYYYKITLK
jgi:hypothetical protein